MRGARSWDVADLPIGARGELQRYPSSAAARHFGIRYWRQNRPVLRLTRSSFRVECTVTVIPNDIQIVAPGSKFRHRPAIPDRWPLEARLEEPSKPV